VSIEIEARVSMPFSGDFPQPAQVLFPSQSCECTRRHEEDIADYPLEGHADVGQLEVVGLGQAGRLWIIEIRKKAQAVDTGWPRTMLATLQCWIVQAVAISQLARAILPPKKSESQSRYVLMDSRVSDTFTLRGRWWRAPQTN
jgi:hypothetical protein